MELKTRSKPAHLAPAGFFLIFPLSFITTLVIALSRGHVKLIIPYISDTGDLPPESSVFSMLVSLCSAVLAVSIYVRHLQVSQELEATGRGQYGWNALASTFGAASTLGLLLVANFQETNVYPIHYVGATACIWGGAIYFIIQTYISHLMRERLTWMGVHYLRVCLSSLTVMFLLIGTVTTMAAINNPPKGIIPKGEVSNWSSTDPFWAAHVLSVSSEWTLALLQSAIILSFVPELRRMKVVFPDLVIDEIAGQKNHQASHIVEDKTTVTEKN